jgi:antitoxin YefM
MTTMTATDARRELFNLIKKTNKGHQCYRIHHRDGSAVLMSEEDYESLIETLQLLSIPGFKSSIRKSVKQMNDGETLSLDEVFAP